MTAIRSALLGLLAAVAAWPATAQVDRHDPRRRLVQEAHRPVAPAAVPAPGSGPEEAADGRSQGRMSPEERRQLRRDIQDARRDLYPYLPRPDQEYRRF